jgi:hypothetical protein
MTWAAAADRLIWVNLAWYLALAAAFCLGHVYHKALYFLGAAILTLGIILAP